MDKNSKIYIAGHNGLVGSAILRALESKSFENLVYRTHGELDLIDQKAVVDFFAEEKPEYVFLAAARVGGIMANSTRPAEFIYQNLMIQSNVMHASYVHGIKKMLFLSSACVYPRACPQPMKEEYLLTGPFEPTNEAYAIAKVAGMNMCRSYNRQYGTNFISVIPINLYGINDNFDPAASHVIPGIMRKFHEAKMNRLPEVSIWGTGIAVREFMLSDDLADACLFLMENFNPAKEQNEKGGMYINPVRASADQSDKPELKFQPNSNLCSNGINVGSGEGVSIKELTELVRRTVGYEGTIAWDSSKPDGMPKKLLDSSKLHAMGWESETMLEDGLRLMYEWYLTNKV